MGEATAQFLPESQRSPHIQLLRRNQMTHKNQMNHKKSSNIMPQKNDFGANEEAIYQERLEENISEQADLTANEPQREQLKIMLVGSAKVVTSAIHYFHLEGYAEVGDWSRSIPSPNNPEEIMRILTRKFTVQ